MSSLLCAANALRVAHTCLQAWVNRDEIGTWMLFDRSRNHSAQGTNIGQDIVGDYYRRYWYYLLAMQMVSLGLFVTIIELFLSWNHASGVYSASSAGQLIPLVTSLTGLIAVCMNNRGRAAQQAHELAVRNHAS